MTSFFRKKSLYNKVASAIFLFLINGNVFAECTKENIDYYLFTIESPNSPLIPFFSAMVFWLLVLKLLKKSRRNKEENEKLISMMKSGGE